MILDKYTYIIGHSRNVKYYRKLGYDISVRERVKVETTHLTPGSTFIVNYKCDECGLETKSQFREYYSYTNGLTENYYCASCNKIKFRNNFMKNHGVDNPMKVKSIKDKLRNTLLERYNVDHYSKTEEYKEKYRNTCYEKWGVDNASKSEKVKKIISDIKFKEHNLPSKISKKLDSDYKVMDYSNDRNFTIYHDVCESNFEIFAGTLNDRLRNNNIICTNCNPVETTTSSGEIELRDFISGLNIKVIQNSYSIIPPLSLDIFLPELNLAIEFNGVYWHSEIHKDKNYHLNKTKLCSELGINLLHVWEDDWRDKRDIVESMILNKVLSISNKIYARKCEIKEISNVKLVKDFLNKNHIQGYSSTKYKIGLYYNDELVSLMTFSKKRKVMELVRFCSKLGTNVIGGASKLFKYFIRKYEYDYIVSYSDISFFNGVLYERLNFNLNGVTPPNYWWVIDKTRKHRFNYRKQELLKIPGVIGSTESEIMHNLGNYRIWGCGLKRWVWER